MWFDKDDERMGLIDILERWSTTRNLLLSIIGSIVIIALMGYGLQVLVYNVYGNYTMPDTRFGYSFEEIQVVFDGLGLEGLQAWTMVHLLDYLFPLVYSFAMVFALGIQLTKLNLTSQNVKRVLLLPILGCIADYIENILVQTQVIAYPNISELVINLASYATIIKWILLALGFVTIMLLSLLVIYQRFSTKSS